MAGPRACTASTAARKPFMPTIGLPASHSSSKWLGVTTSASGSAEFAKKSGTPGLTKTPGPASPITGSQRSSAAGFSLFMRLTARRMASPVSGAPQDVAGEQPVADAEDAAFGNVRHAIVDHLRVEGPAAKRAVARMIGELHGMHRPDLDAHALEREDGGGIADMAVGDVRLDRGIPVPEILDREPEGSRPPPENVLAGELEGSRSALFAGRRLFANRSSKVAGRSIFASLNSGVKPTSMSSALFIAAASIRPVCGSRRRARAAKEAM